MSRLALSLKCALVVLSLAGGQALRAEPADHEATMELIRQQFNNVDLQRVVVISGKMDLSPPTAQRFWPLYKSYLADVVVLRDKQLRNLGDYAALLNSGKISGDSARALVHASLDLEKSRLENRQRMIRRASAVLSPTQTLLLYQLEVTMESQIRAKLLEQVPYAGQ